MAKLSVIIPTRNRSADLCKMLESLCGQTLPQSEFEAIVVDNGSSDSTRDVVEAFRGRLSNLAYLYDDAPGLHVGRHRGMAAAASDLLVFADDDIVAFPTWLEAVLESFSDPAVALVGGKVLPLFDVEPPRWLCELWDRGAPRRMIPALSIIDFGDEAGPLNPYFVFGCNFSVRRSVLRKAGGFHPDAFPQDLLKFRGDGECAVSEYVQQQGLGSVYNPRAGVRHRVSAQRMTRRYMQQRSYSQGISDSYTDIRRGGGRNLFVLSLRLLAGSLLGRNVGHWVYWLKGYHFHRLSCRRDPALVAWVHKPVYYED